MTTEYLTQIKPVHASATFWDMLSLSAGRLKSFTPAATRHHFINGAQKKTVFGPAGWFMNAENFDPAAADAAPDIGNDLKGTSKEMNVEVTQVSKK